jgi:acetyl esterase
MRRVERLEGALLRRLMNLPPRVQRVLLLRPVRRDGLTLAPEIQLMLRLQRWVREPRMEDLPLPQARRRMVRQTRHLGGVLPIGNTEDLTVDGAEGPLQARLYVPAADDGGAPAPLLVWFHGGGMTFGDLRTHDPACRFLAEEAGVRVLAVTYRRAPEHPFPAGVDDAAAAYRWVVDHTDDLGADPARLAIGGDSAGGYLAAVTAVVAAEQGLPLAFQLLVYPVTDHTRESRSRREFSEGFVLTSDFIQRANDGYLPPGTDLADPRVSVLMLKNVPAGLAPAYVATAGFDPLRDEGEAYGALLAAHGVPTEVRRYPSLVHGFVHIVGTGHDAPAAMAEIARVLRRALA